MSADKQERQDGFKSYKSAFLNLVDLAGSERASQTGATGIRLREGKFFFWKEKAVHDYRVFPKFFCFSVFFVYFTFFNFRWQHQQKFDGPWTSHQQVE